jgi:hypothetical protein
MSSYALAAIAVEEDFGDRMCVIDHSSLRSLVELDSLAFDVEREDLSHI